MSARWPWSPSSLLRFSLSRRGPSSARRVLLVAAAALAACQTKTAAPTPICDTIADLCHPFDHGAVGGPHECHLVAHTGDETACAEKVLACRAACSVVPDQAAAGPGDGSSSLADDAGATTSAGADVAAAGGDDGACALYCACVTKQCAQPADAPAWVKDPALCPATCASFSAQERACWGRFCDANAAVVPVHNCVHAWGGHGLEECN